MEDKRNCANKLAAAPIIAAINRVGLENVPWFRKIVS